MDPYLKVPDNRKKKKLSSEELVELQEMYLTHLDPEEDELLFARDILEQSMLGIKARDFLSLLGYHTSDYSALATIQRKMNKRWPNLHVKQMKNYKGKRKDQNSLILEENKNWLKYMGAVRTEVRDSGIKEHPALTQSRSEHRKLQAEKKANAKLQRQSDHSLRHFTRLEALKLPHVFTVYDVAEQLKVSRSHASNFISKLVADGLVTRLFVGGGKGSYSLYKVTTVDV